MTPLEIVAAIGGGASPIVMAVGLWVQGNMNARERANAEAKREQALEHADSAVLEKVIDHTRVMQVFSDELKRTNDQHAAHEKDCARRWGQADERMERLIEQGKEIVDVKNKISVLDSEMDQAQDALEWGTRRFEEIFRTQAEFAKKFMVVLPGKDESQPRPAPRRTSRRKVGVG